MRGHARAKKLIEEAFDGPSVLIQVADLLYERSEKTNDPRQRLNLQKLESELARHNDEARRLLIQAESSLRGKPQ